MLKPVSLYLAKQGYVVSVVARASERLNALAADEPAINPVQIDYHDIGAFAEKLREAVAKHGQLELAVVWIHRTAMPAYYAVAQFVGSQEKPGRYVHVLGSPTADPADSAMQEERRSRFAALRNVKYQEVILGWMVEDGKTRWLKQEEIANGVIYAVQHAETQQHVVGTVTPWEMRPPR